MCYSMMRRGVMHCMALMHSLTVGCRCESQNAREADKSGNKNNMEEAFH
jgi:hypothetical protein